MERDVAILRRQGNNTSAVREIRENVREVEREVGQQRGLTPAAPIELVAQSAIYFDRTGYPRGRISVTHPPVERSTTGEPVDVDSYELWIRLFEEQEDPETDEPLPDRWVHVDLSPEPRLSVDDLVQGARYEIRTRAVGVWARKGRWSSTIQVTVERDTTPPRVPTTPETAVSLGVVLLGWDGRFSGGTQGPDPDYAYTRVEVSTDGETFMDVNQHFNLGGSIPFSGYPLGEAVFFRLVAVDTTGNESAPSGVAVAVPERLVDVDLIDTTIGEAIEQNRQRAQEAIENSLGAQSAADAAHSAAEAAQGQARSAEQAALDAAGIAAEKGSVIFQISAPTGGRASSQYLWVRKPDFKVHVYDEDQKKWVAATDPDLVQVAQDAAQAAAEAAAARTAAEEAATESSLARGEAQAAQGAADSARTAADAAGSAAAAAQAEAEKKASPEWVLSRGTDLVTNGTGYLGDNTNFSSFTYDPKDAPVGARGSFVIASNSRPHTAWPDELLPVTPERRYLLSIMAREQNPDVEGNSTFYTGLAPYDAQGNSILPHMYSHDPLTMTALSAPLNPGDTTIQVESAENFGRLSNADYVGVWNWTDPDGRTWEAGTYTKDHPQYASIDGNTIRLATPFRGEARPVGTPVSNNRAGGNYMYAAHNKPIPNEWERTTASFGGIHSDLEVAARTAFPPATAAVRIIFLPNYQGARGSRQAFAAVSFSDATAALAEAGEARARADAAQSRADRAAAEAAQAASDATAAHQEAGAARVVADAAMASASGKTTVHHDYEEPSGTANPGDLWWMHDSDTGAVVGQWRWASGTPFLVNAFYTTDPYLEGTPLGQGRVKFRALHLPATGWSVGGDSRLGDGPILEWTFSSPGDYWVRYYGSDGTLHQGPVTITAAMMGTQGIWVREEFASEAIANLDVGKLTVGTGAFVSLDVANILRTNILTVGAIDNPIILADGVVTADAVYADEEMGAKLGQFIRVRAGMIESDAVESTHIKAGSILFGHLSGDAIDGKVVTGATFQTRAAFPKVILDSDGLRAHVNSSIQRFSIDARTGNIDISGASITGGMVTAATVQSSATSNRGVKITSTGLFGYNTSGNRTAYISASNGSVDIAGTLRSGLGSNQVVIDSNVFNGRPGIRLDTGSSDPVQPTIQSMGIGSGGYPAGALVLTGRETRVNSTGRADLVMEHGGDFRLTQNHGPESGTGIHKEGRHLDLQGRTKGATNAHITQQLSGSTGATHIDGGGLMAWNVTYAAPVPEGVRGVMATAHAGSASTFRAVTVTANNPTASGVRLVAHPTNSSGGATAVEYLATWR